MEPILFKQQLKRNQICSSTHPTIFEFEGVNASNQTQRVLSWTSSCGCTKPTYPTEVQPGETFIVNVIIDKTGQSGNFNQSVTLKYESGQEVKLKVNGTIEQTNLV